MYSDLYQSLKAATDVCIDTEDELRAKWYATFAQYGIKFNVEVDRIDLRHNRVLIELKKKGAFNGSETSIDFINARDERLLKYIKRTAKNEGLAQEAYTGIASDGIHLAFCFLKNGEIYHQQLMPVSLISITKVMKALQNADRRALTTKNLLNDFGHQSVVGKRLMSALSNELSIHFNALENNKITMLFNEWQSLFGQVAGLTDEQKNKIYSQIAFNVKSLKKDDIAGLLFVIHTYNALVMKLIGAELVSYLGLTQYTDFCDNLVNLAQDELFDTLRKDIEKSRFFETVGIKGFVEEAIFSWYLDTTQHNDKQEIALAIKEALLQISLYRFDDLTSARSKDVLKGFYQGLVPDVLRKSLGEFYTPDWLVADTLNRANDTSWLDKRVLDPTCGSGSFLLQTIKLKRAEAKQQGLDVEQTVDMLLSTVFGFDLNPLAVQTARVNFLIAISDLVAQCGAKEIELPILLADSVYSPAKNVDDDIVQYKIGRSENELLVSIPSILAFDRTKLEQAFKVMERGADESLDFVDIEQQLILTKVCSDVQMSQWRALLRDTYERVLSLHEGDGKGVWFSIIRNFFWSANAGEFDLIVGNPPWVRWSALPSDYREKVKPTFDAYEIFSQTKYHGGNELDISGMITYTASDKWLRVGGKLVFVITQTHLQSPSSAGFRNFKINNDAYLKPIFVEDLKALKPFAQAANKTAIVGFEKTNTKTKAYPVPYAVWQATKGQSKAIKEHLSIDQVLAGINRIPMEANPVDESTSPWAIMNVGEFEKTNTIRGKSDWISGRKGVTADLNGIYMVNILQVDEKRGLVQIQTRPEAGKKNIGNPRKFWIEPAVLYPMVKGAADFSGFKFNPSHSLFHIIPNQGITKQLLLDAEQSMLIDHPKTLEYLTDYRKLLVDRSTYKLRLSKYAFYHIYNVGNYSFAPYKVMWAEQSGRFKAAVCANKAVPLVGDRPYVPDHKVYFVDCDDKTEAYYICGLLNCSLVRHYIESHTISIQVSNVFKHLNLPTFDKLCSDSQKLAKLSEQLHSTEDERLFAQLQNEANELALNVIA